MLWYVPPAQLSRLRMGLDGRQAKPEQILPCLSGSSCTVSWVSLPSTQCTNTGGTRQAMTK